MKTYSSSVIGERRHSIACPLCGSTDFRTFLAGEGYRFVRCRRCRLVYQNPQPDFEDLRGRYEDAYFHYELENEANFFQLQLLSLKDIGFPLESPDPKAGFLDIGCATGMLLGHLQERGWRTEGVEIDRVSAEYGIRERKLKIHVGTLEEAGFAEGSFGIVHFSHLIEHVPDPRRFLLEVLRILKPGGKAIVTTPNLDGFQARLLRGRWRSAIADHLTLFSKPTMRRLLESTGFQVLLSFTWGGIAKGLAPLFVKKPLDAMAKRFGFGDVMLWLAARPPGTPPGNFPCLSSSGPPAS